MKFKINNSKRIRILKTILFKIKREHDSFADEPWFNVFVKKFADECGLEKTSTRTSRGRTWKYGTNTNDIYFFKIVDRQKYLLAKIKYGI